MLVFTNVWTLGKAVAQTSVPLSPMLSVVECDGKGSRIHLCLLHSDGEESYLGKKKG